MLFKLSHRHLPPPAVTLPVVCGIMVPSNSRREDCLQFVGKCENIYGEQLLFSIRQSREDSCCYKEFILESPQFKCKKWVSLLTAIAAIFLHLGLHKQSLFLLTLLGITSAFLLTIKMYNKVKRGNSENPVVRSSFVLQNESF